MCIRDSDKMIRLLFADGVRFPNNKVAKFSRLSPIGEDFLHAEGEWASVVTSGEGNTQTVACLLYTSRCV